MVKSPAMKITLVALIAATILVSLYSCECRITCAKDDYRVRINMTGFSDTELTPLILKSYVKGSGFTQLTDSISRHEFSNNATNGQGQIVNSIGLLYGAERDYTIDLPTIGRSYQLTNLNFETEVCKMCGRKYTIHTLSGYTLNDSVHIANATGSIELVK